VWVCARGCVIVATMLRPASVLALVTLIGCSGGSSAGPGPQPIPTAAPVPAPAAVPSGDAPAPVAPAPTTSPAPGPAAAVRVDESQPKGVAPLSKEEEAELKRDCGSYTQAMSKKVEGASNRLDGTVKLLEALKDDTSNPRCKTLLQRQLGAYLAQVRETTALNDLRMIMVGQSDAFNHNGTLCPATPPVPTELSELKGSYIAPDDVYDAKAWSCIGFHLHGRPQHYQYEVRRIDDSHFEVIARGYPVPGGELSVLSLKGEVKDGAVPLHSNVFRRSE